MKSTKLKPVANTDNLVAVLSRLSIECEKDAKRFERAAREVSNEELALLFERYARRRSEFAKELAAHVDGLEGREPEPTSLIRVQGRRGSSKQVTGRRDDGTILCDCEQAEKSLCALYEEALRRELPGDLQMSLRRHYLVISEVYNQMRDLCEALAWCAVPMAV